MEGGVMDSPDDTLTRAAYEDDVALRGCCSPKRRMFRFLGLALMCFFGFGSTFCYDNPAALQDNFKRDLGLSTTNFVMLYSIYSWPNIIFCFLGGYLIDSFFGLRLGTVLYMGLTLLGQLIFATGAIMNSFWSMMLGRLVFGIGAESLVVSQNNWAVLWFKGKELNMVFGLQLSFSRVGSTVNFLVMEPIYNYVATSYSGPTCIGIVLFLASLTCVFSFICTIILSLMDKRAERLLKRGYGEEPKEIHLSDVKDFKLVFWLITVICIAYYMAIFPFVALGKVFFMKKYGYEAATANNINSLIFSVAAVASPLMGIIVDKTGRNVFWVFVSIAGTMIAHGLLTFSYANPYVCMIFMGLAYSMLAGSLWPLIALVVPEYQLGTAYGLAQAFQNLGLAVVSLLTGMIVDAGGYFMLEIFFLAWLWISLITIIVIWISDSATTGGFLNMTPNERELYESALPSQDILEREKLLSNESTSDLSADDLLQPQSDIRIRNRYLARIGAEPPSHVKIPAYRPLR